MKTDTASTSDGIYTAISLEERESMTMALSLIAETYRYYAGYWEITRNGVPVLTGGSNQPQEESL